MRIPLCKNQNQNTSRGFTLVETLIYGAGLVIILGGLSVFLYYLYNWYRLATIPTRTDAAGLTLMNVVMTDVRVANTVNDSGSIFNTANGYLSVTTSANSLSTTTIYYLENGHLKSKVGSAATSTISAADSYISGFYAKKFTTSNSSAVRVELDIDYSIKGATTTKVYSDLAILRQSYE